jgi:hypothetical protein
MDESRACAQTTTDRERMQELCERVADGSMVGDVAPEIFGSMSSMYRAMARTPGLREMLDDARVILAHRFAEQAVTVVDTVADVQRARLKSESLRWYASKVAPKDYGDRIDMHVDGQVSVLGAISDAAMRSIRDRQAYVDAQIVDEHSVSTSSPSDSISEDAPPALPCELPGQLE